MALVSAVLSMAPAASAGASPSLGAERDFVPGELVVKFRPAVGAATRAALLDRQDATIERHLSTPGVKLVDLAAGESVRGAAESFEDTPQVLYAEPNFVYRAQALPDDPFFPSLWGLENAGQAVNGVTGIADADIDAPRAWDVTTGDSSVVVAVADTGVAYGHPDLAPNMLAGKDFVDDDEDPLDFNGHGTHVAGTIGAVGDNGIGVAGVSWGVSLLPVRVLDGEGDGDSVEVAQGFEYAAEQGAQIVNASLSGGNSSLLREAIEDAPDTLFVVAAGNDKSDNEVKPRYPCNYTAANVLCVAATNQADNLASFSNFGVNSVDLAAPGTNVLSTTAAYGTPIFSEGFESGLGPWTTGGTNDTWALTEEAKNGGSFSLADSPGGNYLNNTDSFARSGPIDLSGQIGCRLDYALRLEVESDFDLLAVEASSDGIAWDQLEAWDGTTNGNFIGANNDLSGLDGEASALIRFRLDTNGTGTAGGAHIDDLGVRCLSPSFTGNELRSLQGTSMATPHVAGAAALILARQPELSPTQVKGKLLSTVDPKPSLAGKTVTGGRLNVGEAINPSPLVIVDPVVHTDPLTESPDGSVMPAAEPAGPLLPTAACQRARAILRKAKNRLAAARRTLRRAKTPKQVKSALRTLARARNQLTTAKIRVKRTCPQS